MSIDNNKKPIYLVADIGGTNIRIAQAREHKLSQLKLYCCNDYQNLFEILQEYIVSEKLVHVELHACLAIACPTDKDWISMTNLSWEFSQIELKQRLSLASLMFINDYTAIAMAIPFLSKYQKVQIAGGHSQANKAISICGPGTGLGVATLIPVPKNHKVDWHCVNSEGGHMDFAPVDDTEIKILSYLKKSKNRVSYEQLLSGYGLEQIYQALRYIHNEFDKDAEVKAADITDRAVNDNCHLCKLALSQFCRVLGSFAGNLALLSTSLGGVYIAGGIVPRFTEFIEKSDFRVRFESKGRLSEIPKQIPTYIIVEPQPGLLGAAVYLKQALETH